MKYQLYSSALLGVGAGAVFFGDHMLVAGALIAAGLFAVTNSIQRKN